MSYQEAISTLNINWKADARKFMEQQVHFVLVDWENSEKHHNECKALAQEFDYQYLLQPENSRAFFKPRK